MARVCSCKRSDRSKCGEARARVAQAISKRSGSTDS
ncbi:TraY domain-containing protein [Leptospira venezuelensis]